MKQDSFSFFSVFLLTFGFFAFLIAIVTVDRNSSALIGETGLFAPSSPLMQGMREFIRGAGRFFTALDSPCFAMLRGIAVFLTKNFLTLFSLPELIRSFFVELFI